MGILPAVAVSLDKEMIAQETGCEDDCQESFNEIS